MRICFQYHPDVFDVTVSNTGANVYTQQEDSSHSSAVLSQPVTESSFDIRLERANVSIITVIQPTSPQLSSCLPLQIDEGKLEENDVPLRRSLRKSPGRAVGPQVAKADYHIPKTCWPRRASAMGGTLKGRSRKEPLSPQEDTIGSRVHKMRRGKAAVERGRKAKR
jgi:hypothetical protein